MTTEQIIEHLKTHDKGPITVWLEHCEPSTIFVKRIEKPFIYGQCENFRDYILLGMERGDYFMGHKLKNIILNYIEYWELEHINIFDILKKFLTKTEGKPLIALLIGHYVFEKQQKITFYIDRLQDFGKTLENLNPIVGHTDLYEVLPEKLNGEKEHALVRLYSSYLSLSSNSDTQLPKNLSLIQTDD